MAEEQQEQSTGGSLKNIILGLVSTITLGVGGWFTTKLTGGDDKEAVPVQQTAPVINIQNNQTQQAGKTVIVNGGGNGAAAKPADAPKPKKKAMKNNVTPILYPIYYQAAGFSLNSSPSFFLTGAAGLAVSPPLLMITVLPPPAC